MTEVTWSSPRERDSPRRLLSPTNRSPVDSALRRIRRSLSRSPSKASFASCSNKPPTSLSRQSPSPNRFQSHAANAPTFSIYDSQGFESSLRRHRPGLRRSTPLSAFARPESGNKDNMRHALSDASDNGNSFTPRSSPTDPAEGQENAAHPNTPPSQQHVIAQTIHTPSFKLDVSRAPTPRFGSRPREWRPAKSSPLKRSDAVMNLTQDMSPAAKRRTICAGVVSSPFEISQDRPEDESEASESEAQQNPPPSSYLSPRPRSPFFGSPKEIPRRQRRSLETDTPRATKPSLRPKPRLFKDTLSSTPRHEERVRQAREYNSPAEKTTMDTTSRPSFLKPRRPAQPHPLSRALSPASPAQFLSTEPSSFERQLRGLDTQQKTDFSQSLPIGALRPTSGSTAARKDHAQASANDSFETPQLYKMARPDPAAFRSTGLISKKHRNPDDLPPAPDAHPGMPDTPCKKGPSGFTFGASPTPAPERLGHTPFAPLSFGTPAHPDNTHEQGGLDRKTSFASLDSESASNALLQYDSQSSTDDFPPTPTKLASHEISNTNKSNSLRSSLFGRRAKIGHNMFRDPNVTDTDVITAPQMEPESHISALDFSMPQTPSDSGIPDPSSLSISHGHKTISSPTPRNEQHFGGRNSFIPATPTHHYNECNLWKGHPIVTPSNNPRRHEADGALSQRFPRVQWLATGEFSHVYKVFEPPARSYFSPLASSKPERTPRPDRVYIVKKSKAAYTSTKALNRAFREASFLKLLTEADPKPEHIVEYVNSWDALGHLYIQTEYCEEGDLEQFLSRNGRRSRLDDFRIWKVMLEISEGLHYMHSRGIMHLDMKPANVFISFGGVLKIGDFGLATGWPCTEYLESEGDRRYMSPDLLEGRPGTPSDIFSLGMIIFEMATNTWAPDNGASWHQLRSEQWSVLPSLTSDSSDSLSADSEVTPGEMDCRSYESLYPSNSATEKVSCDGTSLLQLSQAPPFMLDQDAPDSLTSVVHSLMRPNPASRPSACQIMESAGCRWVDERRRSGAVIYEGPWGPSQHVLKSTFSLDSMLDGGVTSGGDVQAKDHRKAEAENVAAWQGPLPLDEDSEMLDVL